VCTNDKYDWKIEGLNLNIQEIIPENIEMKVWGRATVGIKEDATSKVVTYLTMWIRNMNLEVKDLKFWFNRKVTPKLEERGIADVNIKGKNELKVTWKIEGEATDTAWIFALEQVSCNLDTLDITIKESTHTWLMKLITSLFSGSIKRSIEDSIEKGIREAMGDLQSGMESLTDRMTDTLKGVL